MKVGHVLRLVVLALPSNPWPSHPTAGGLAPQRKFVSDAKVQHPKSTAGGGGIGESENKVRATRVVPDTLPDGGGNPRRFPPGGGGTAEVIFDVFLDLPPMVTT